MIEYVNHSVGTYTQPSLGLDEGGLPSTDGAHHHGEGAGAEVDVERERQGGRGSTGEVSWTADTPGHIEESPNGESGGGGAFFDRQFLSGGKHCAKKKHPKTAQKNPKTGRKCNGRLTIAPSTMFKWGGSDSPCV